VKLETHKIIRDLKGEERRGCFQWTFFARSKQKEERQALDEAKERKRKEIANTTDGEDLATMNRPTKAKQTERAEHRAKEQR